MMACGCVLPNARAANLSSAHTLDCHSEYLSLIGAAADAQRYAASWKRGHVDCTRKHTVGQDAPPATEARAALDRIGVMVYKDHFGAPPLVVFSEKIWPLWEAFSFPVSFSPGAIVISSAVFVNSGGVSVSPVATLFPSDHPDRGSRHSPALHPIWLTLSLF